MESRLTPHTSVSFFLTTPKSATAGAWFRYTLDGTTPTRTRGYVYAGDQRAAGDRRESHRLSQRHGE